MEETQHNAPTDIQRYPDEKKQAVLRLYAPDGATAHQRLLIDSVKLDLCPPGLLPVPMPAPSIKSLEDEIRRLRGQTYSWEFHGSEAFLVDFQRVYAQIKQLFVTIVDGLRPAMQALVQFLTGNPHLVPSVSLQQPRLSPQSRRYLMVKQREQARRMRHGRNRYAGTL